MKLDTMKKLYIDQLKDMYSGEKQLLKALPKMSDFASNDELKDAFAMHLVETEKQVQRLEDIFEDLGISGSGKTCKAMKGLIEEAEELMDEEGVSAVLDAGLIAAAQRVEHYEMAGYGCLRSFADILDEKNAAVLLQKTLDEESNADKKLSKLAVSSVNLEAMRVSKDGADRDEGTFKNNSQREKSRTRPSASR